ncbi:MAG TPA: serpin family protein [Gemmatimonadaceae bacterium]|jgi:serine protease inhibitor|nr:serpin family protein [Gemmatimonadaceae bacterium]
MRLPRRTLRYAALAVVLTACSDPQSPGHPAPSLDAAEQQVSSSGNEFSFALFQQLAKREAGKNVFVSPLSASMSLGMAMNGAAGPTFDAMRTALRLGTGDMGQIDAGYRGLVDLLRGLDPTTTFQIANSIWYRNSVSFRQSFLDTTKKYFDAQVQGLNFADATGSLATINAWVSANTGGKIPKILDEITPDEVMFLINAIYFKGTWQMKFDPALTTPDRFVAADGTIQTVPFMNRREHLKPMFLFGATQQQVSIVELPYGNGDFAMDIILPPPNASVDSTAAALTSSAWGALIASLREVDYALAMPKFTLSYERTLTDDLSALGMGVAFTDQANFSGMSAVGLKLEFVKQKTFVDVNEAGTEAGASTVTGVVPTSLTEVRVNRPFIFVIRERQTGTIVFMGKLLRVP